MYGKFFSSTFTGSMFGAGADVFAVWGYVIANTVDSMIELNPDLIAAILGSTPEKVASAIEFLCRPDIKSRNPDEQGRRLIHEGAFQYRVVSHEIYRAIRNEEDRRAANRERQRKHREKIYVTRDSNASSRKITQSPHTEAEAEAYTEAGKSKSFSAKAERRTATRIPDNFEVSPEIREWATANKMPSPDAHLDGFRDYWMAKAGQAARKVDWEATFRNWLRNESQRRQNGNGKQGAFGVLAELREAASELETGRKSSKVSR